MLFGIGNQHPELARVMWALCIAIALVVAVIRAVSQAEFDFEAMCNGLAVLLLAGAGATAGKDLGVAKSKAIENAANSPGEAP
jgi:ABC-type branched-subunit amino acid transport system permease subunit